LREKYESDLRQIAELDLPRPVIEWLAKYYIAEGKPLLDMIMPNGKPLRDCTGTYIGKLGRDLAKAGKKLIRENS
jgi:hypothetical protein